MMTNTQSHTDTTAPIRAVYAAFATGDIPAVLELFDPQIEWVETAGSVYTGTFVGPRAVVEGVFGRLASEWSSFTVTPEEYIAEGDTVAVLGTYTGTHAITGRSMTARFVHAWQLRDGRAVRMEQVVDTALLNAATR